MYPLRIAFSKAGPIAAAALLAMAVPVMAQEPAPAAQAPAAAMPAAAKPEKKPAPSPKSLAAWRGKVISHLNGNKSASAVADGTATVAFRIDRSGKVLSSQVVASSGNKAL